MPHNSLLPLFLLLLLSVPAAHAGWPQPILLKDTFPGLNEEYIREPIVVNDTIFFVAYDGTSGEIWQSRGTSDTTRVLVDVTSPSAVSSIYPNRLTPWRNGFFFINFEEVHGEELWFSDGTSSGTHRLAILAYPDPAWNSSSGTRLFYPTSNGMYIFSSHRSSPGGVGQYSSAIFRVDDPTSSVVPVTPYGVYDRDRQAFCNNNFIFAGGNSEHGEELFHFDPVTSLPALLKDINPTTYTMLGELIIHESSRPSLFFTLKDQAFFVATTREDGEVVDSIFTSDGTSSGTFRVSSSFPNVGYKRWNTPDQYSFALPIYDRIVFPVYNNDSELGCQLYSFDGTTSGTRPISRFSYSDTDILTPLSTGPQYILFAMNGVMWRTDGTSTGTWKIDTSAIVPNTAKHFTPHGEFTFFVAYRADYVPLITPPSIWVTDGTPNGTMEILRLTGIFHTTHKMFVYRDRLFFLDFDLQHGTELRSINLMDRYKLSARDWTGYD